MNPLEFVSVDPQITLALAFFLWCVMAVLQEFSTLNTYLKGIAFGISLGLAFLYAVQNAPYLFWQVLVNGGAIFVIGYLGSLGTNYLGKADAVRTEAIQPDSTANLRRWYSRW